MEAIARELKQFNFPEIIVELYKARKTGTLIVYTGDVTKKVYFDRGNAVFAASTDEDERLGETLIKLGKITLEQYEESVRILKETGKRQGSILVELGYLAPRDLVLGVKSQVREIIYSLFQIEDADFEFNESELPTREVITLQMGIGNLLYEGIKRIGNVVRIKRSIPQMDAVLELCHESERHFPDIILSQKDKVMLSMIDGEKTVKDLIDSTPAATFEAMKTISVLLVAGFVRVKERKRSNSALDIPSTASDPSVPADRNDGESFEDRVANFFADLYARAPHEILGIHEGSDTKSVEETYHQLVREFHPDHALESSDPLMLDKLLAITEAVQHAYDLLKDDISRQSYFHRLSRETEGKRVEEWQESGEPFGSSAEGSETYPPDDEPVEPDIGERRHDVLLNGFSLDEPPAFPDYTFEEQCEGIVAVGKEDSDISLTPESGPFGAYGGEGAPREGEYAHTPDNVSGEVSDERCSGFNNDQSTLSWEESSAIEGRAEGTEEGDTGDQAVEPVVTDEGADSESYGMPAPLSQNDENERPETGINAPERRRHKRYKVRDARMSGEMVCLREAQIVDMSVSGIALKVDKQLRVGREYLLNLQGNGSVITVKAEVVRSTLIESKVSQSGDVVPLYLVGMAFRNINDEVRENLEEFINTRKIEEKRTGNGKERDGSEAQARFRVDAATTVLDLKTRCEVKVLSLCGMLIESQNTAGINDTLRMTISLAHGRNVDISGRVVSCRALPHRGERYEIAIEFMEFSGDGKEILREFLDSIDRESVMRGGIEGRETEIVNSVARLERDVGEQPPLQDETHSETGSTVDGESVTFGITHDRLIELTEEIKTLIAEFREEVAKLRAVTSGKDVVIPETRDLRGAVTAPRSEVSERDSSLPSDEVWQDAFVDIPETVEKYLAEEPAERSSEMNADVPRARRAPKKKRLWYILVPVLFLMAAGVSFFFISLPDGQKAVVERARPIGGTAVTSGVEPQRSGPSSPDAAKTPPAVAPGVALHTVSLIASDTTWVSATFDEKTTKEMLLRPGDRISWTVKRNVSLVIGNAAGVKVVFDGQEIVLPGGKGKVVRTRLPQSAH